MKTSGKQIVVGFLVGSFLTFIILCTRNIYINWPGPGERGYEEVKAVFEIFHGPWFFQLTCLAGVTVLAFLTVRTTNRLIRKRKAAAFKSI